MSPSARVAPLMPVALAVAGGIVVDRYGAPLATATWAALASMFGVTAWFACERTRLYVPALLGSFLALAGAWHHGRWSDVAADDLSRALTDAPRPVWVRGVIVDVPGFRPSADGTGDGVTRAVLEITSARDGEAWRCASGRALVAITGDRGDLRAGQRVEAAGGLATIPGPLNPGEFDYRAYLRTQGIRLHLGVEGPGGVWEDLTPGPAGWGNAAWLKVLSWLGVAQAWSREKLARSIDPGAGPLAEALLLGRREGVDPDLNDAFARTGTTHLLAISGLHMQVLALALGGLLRALGLGRRPTFAAVAAGTVAYALLVGLMPSVVRSAAMTVTYCTAGFLDRRHRPGNTLALAAIVTLALNPAHLFDVGCQLSFLAVGVIVWGFGPVSERVVPERPPDALDRVERLFQPRWKKWLRGSITGMVRGVVLSTLVWLAAVPLVALRFHLVSPVGILLNVPLIPLTSGALLAAGIALSLATFWGPLGWPAAWCAARMLELTAEVVRWGEKAPWGHVFVPEPSTAWVLAFYATLGLAAAAVLGSWPGWRVIVGFFLCTAALGIVLAVRPLLLPVGHSPPTADVLAVGHGLAVLVETGGGRGVLYDCGRMRDPSVGRRIVAPAAWARGIRRLDAVILSHADADHYDGLPDLLERIPIRVVMVPEGFAGESNPGAGELLSLVRSRGVPVRAVTAGETWTAGATRFAVLHPPRGWNREAPDNARSVVLDISWHARHAILTGDLEGEGLALFTASAHEGALDVLLSPHHGGRAANPASLYEALHPASVIVSQRPPVAGSRDPLASLSDRGIPLFRTWQSGALRMEWTGRGISISGFKSGTD